MGSAEGKADPVSNSEKLSLLLWTCGAALLGVFSIFFSIYFVAIYHSYIYNIPLLYIIVLLIYE